MSLKRMDDDYLHNLYNLNIENESETDSEEDGFDEERNNFKIENLAVNLLVKIEEYCDKTGCSELYSNLKVYDIIDFLKDNKILSL